MSDLFFKRKNIFDILNEAPEDGGANDAGDNAEANASDAGDNAEANDDAGNEDAGNEDETDMGNDEDFDVDTTVDGDDAGDDPDSTEDTDDSGSMDSGGGGLGGDSEEEVNPKNTDIFASLSKEEQAIKISELKKKFNELYVYISDMNNKINDINPDEDNLESIYRITYGLYSLKDYIGDYIKNIFSIKSYIENDIAYNRFLIIIQSMTQIINTLSKEIEDKIQKDDKK